MQPFGVNCAAGLSNRLFYGDNLEVMRKHIGTESVDLCYIDPPFNSNRNYNQIYNNVGNEDKAQSQAFSDTWEWGKEAESAYVEITENKEKLYPIQTVNLIIGLSKVLKGSLFAYLVNMTLRIAEIYRVLKCNGSFYLHCDSTASHYLKLVSDSVFCTRGGDFLNEIVWNYGTYLGRVDSARYFLRKHDIIFVYVKGTQYLFNRPDALDNFRETVDGQRWRKYFVEGNKIIEGNHPTTDTRFIQYRNKWIKEHGRIPEKGETIYECKGDVITDNWTDIKAVDPKSRERLGYPTQKPLALLERIIKTSSKEDSIILDAFCGCGTTVAAAQRLHRRWIGIDITYQSIAVILKRLEDTYGKEVLDTIEISGIPKDKSSAEALAHKANDRTRKEFEKWAILTYSANKAIVNERKGKDYGVDGRAYIYGEKEILFSVKSGKVNAGMIRDLRGTIERENAAAGVFITLESPTRGMQKEAAAARFYQNEYMTIEKIKIVTVDEILAGARLAVILTKEVLKKAQAKGAEQIGLGVW